MKVYLITLAITFFSGQLRAQTTSPLKEGDLMPDLSLSNDRINLPANIKNLYDFHGKIILLDFWNVYCAGCIKAFPKLEKLQREFDGDLQVLLVTTDSEDKVKSLFSRAEAARTSLPIIYADTTFSNVFPLKIPHHAWLDSGMRLLAVATPDGATRDNLTAILSGDEPIFAKAAFRPDFLPNTPLIKSNVSDLNEDGVQYSFFSRYIPGISYRRGIAVDSLSGDTVRMSFYNTAPIDLIRMAWGGFADNDNTFGLPGNLSKIFFETERKRDFVPPSSGGVSNWYQKNSLCYEIMESSGVREDIRQRMKKDLNAYLGIDVRQEVRQVKCLKLVKTSEENTFKTDGGMRGVFSDNASNMLKFRKITAKQVVRNLAVFLPDEIIVDGTKYDGLLDLDISRNYRGSLIKTRSALNKYGLDLRETVEEISIWVIKDN